MALFKKINQPDGVETSYHRILFVQSMVNSHTSIAVLSYIDQVGSITDGAESHSYKVSATYETDYDENMTVKKAYDYLKTIPEFEGATDI